MDHSSARRGAGKMKLPVLTVALAAAAAGSDVTKKILRDITKFNNDAACWGIENRMQYALAQMKATEECSESDHHNLLKPANPFLALLQPVNNPFQTLPGNTNSFQTLPSRPNSPAGNTLNKLLRGSSSSPSNFGGQQATKPQFNVDNWNRMWSQVFSRQKRPASRRPSRSSMWITGTGCGAKYSAGRSARPAMVFSSPPRRISRSSSKTSRTSKRTWRLS